MIRVNLSETEIHEIVINSRMLAMRYTVEAQAAGLEYWDKASYLEAAERLNKLAAKLESGYDSGSF